MVTIQLDIPGQGSDTRSGEPLRVVDERTNQIYYLISATQFEQVQSLFGDNSFSVADAEEAQSESALKAGWDDPSLDVYASFASSTQPS